MKEEEGKILNKITILHPKIVTTMAAASAAPNDYDQTLTLQQEEDEDQKDETLDKP